MRLQSLAYWHVVHVIILLLHNIVLIGGFHDGRPARKAETGCHTKCTNSAFLNELQASLALFHLSNCVFLSIVPTNFSKNA